MPDQLRDTAKSDHVYLALKKLVASGQFRPGEKLGIRRLADGLGVSTTPVRESLIRLALEEFVVPLPNEGFFAKPFDAAEIRADLELAFMIEKYGIESNVESFDFAGIRGALAELDTVTDELGSQSEPAPGLVAFLEQLTERLSALTGNGKAVRIAGRSSERLHHIRLIGFEKRRYRLDILHLIKQLLQQLEGRRSHDAIIFLQRLMERQIHGLPELVNEANGRALVAHPHMDRHEAG